MLDAAAPTTGSSQSTDSINASTSSTDGPYFRTIRQQLIAPDGAPAADAKRGASLSTVMFNLLATCLGSGILGLPFAYAASGFVGGPVLLLLCAGLSAFGAHLLVEAADRSGRPASFYSVAQAAGGPKAGVFMDALIFLMSFGAAVSYLIVVGGVLPDVAMSFGATGLLATRAPWMLGAMTVAAPLSCLRDLSALRVAAYVTFLMTLYITVVVVLFALLPADLGPCEGTANHSAASPLDCRGDVAPLTGVMPTLGALPIYIFAFTNQQNAIAATNDMDRRARHT